MKIVIDISKDRYEQIKSTGFIQKGTVKEIVQAILDGIVLPEKHEEDVSLKEYYEAMMKEMSKYYSAEFEDKEKIR